MYDGFASRNSAYLSRLILTSCSRRTWSNAVFGCFDGPFRSAKLSFSFRRSSKHYSLHYKLHALTWARAKHDPFHWAGLERPHGSLWPRSGCQKWGRSSPAPVFARAQFLVARSATVMLFNTFVHPQCERNDERRGEPCLSYRVHP